MRPQQTVGRARDLHVLGLGERVVEAAARGVDRQDVVLVPVEDQRGLVGGADGLDVLAEVLDPGGHDRVGGDRRRGRGGVPVGGHDLLADALAQVLVQVVEVLVELGEPGVAVVLGRGDDAVEDLLRDALRVVVALDQERLERGEEGELGDALVAVVPDVAGEFAGAHGEADEDDLAQVERLEDLVQVGGEGVVVVPGADLARLAEAAAVVGDDAVPGREELAGLALPAVAVERVAVDEDDGLPLALVLVVELDGGAVLGSDGDGAHDSGPFIMENDRSPLM
jgi:hypothetical protein